MLVVQLVDLKLRLVTQVISLNQNQSHSQSHSQNLLQSQSQRHAHQLISLPPKKAFNNCMKEVKKYSVCKTKGQEATVPTAAPKECLHDFNKWVAKKKPCNKAKLNKAVEAFKECFEAGEKLCVCNKKAHQLLKITKCNSQFNAEKKKIIDAAKPVKKCTDAEFKKFKKRWGWCKNAANACEKHKCRKDERENDQDCWKRWNKSNESKPFDWSEFFTSEEDFDISTVNSESSFTQTWESHIHEMSTCKGDACGKPVADYIKVCSYVEKIAETGKKTKISKSNACPNLTDIEDDFDISDDAFDFIESWKVTIPDIDMMFDDDFCSIDIHDFETGIGGDHFSHLEDIDFNFDHDPKDGDWHVWEENEVSEEISHDVTHPTIDEGEWDWDTTPSTGGDSCDNDSIEDEGVVCVRASPLTKKALKK
eukprot:scpid78200/ scgid27179/ 